MGLNLKILKMSPALYTESFADRTDHFADVFVRVNVAYGYDVMTFESKQPTIVLSCLVLCRISASPGTPTVRWSTEWNFILNSKMVFHHPIYTV